MRLRISCHYFMDIHFNYVQLEISAPVFVLHSEEKNVHARFFSRSHKVGVL